MFPLFPLHRGPPRSSSSDPDFVVVDGVPVMLPTYDEAVNGGSSALGPGYLASVGQGCPLPVDDQSPPAYPGSGDTDTGPGESETCDSTSGSSEMLQSLYPPPMCQGASHPAPDTPDTISSTAGEVASTSPGIDIADGKHFQSCGQHPSAGARPWARFLPSWHCFSFSLLTGLPTGPVVGKEWSVFCEQ